MAPTYKLTYFPSIALGESIRFLLSYGGFEFEDFRFERVDWPKIKPNMPFGQVPVLEVDGKQAYQSIAICRFLAKKMNLTGANDWEDMEIDAIVDTVNDFRGRLVKYHYEADPIVKEKYKIPLFNEIIPDYLGRFEAIAKANNGHLALGKLTWADFYFVSLLDYFNPMVEKNIIADYPNLRAVESNVLSLPAIKAWIERRPASK